MSGGPGSTTGRGRAAATAAAKWVVVAAAPLWDAVYVARYRRDSGWQGPVPPFNNRRRVGAWKIPYFFASGKASHDQLVELMIRYTGRPLDELSVLDLACGPGRIAQYFDGAFARFSVCDVDPTAISYLQRHFPRLEAVVNSSAPPLPFPDETFDVVYSWSLWTHLPADRQQQYLDEVRRILRPGGWALVTTNGHTFLDEYHAYPRVEPWWRTVSHEQLRRDGMVYHEYDFVDDDATDALSGVSGSFGLTFHDPAFIRDTWGTTMEVVAVVEGAMANHQDQVVLRKGGQGA